MGLRAGVRVAMDCAKTTNITIHVHATNYLLYVCVTQNSNRITLTAHIHM